MVLHEHDIRVSNGSRDPIALRLVQRQPIIRVVHDGSPIELQSSLAGPDQWLPLHHGQRCRVWHVRVKRRPRPRNLGMQSRVDIERGIFRHPVAGYHGRWKSQISSREAVISANDHPSGLTRNTSSRPGTMNDR